MNFVVLAMMARVVGCVNNLDPDLLGVSKE